MPVLGHLTVQAAVPKPQELKVSPGSIVCALYKPSAFDLLALPCLLKTGLEVYCTDSDLFLTVIGGCPHPVFLELLPPPAPPYQALIDVRGISRLSYSIYVINDTCSIRHGHHIFFN